MTSYFLGLRNLLCRSLGLKFEANDFLGTGKISDNDPYPIFTSVAPRIEDKQINPYATFFTRMRQVGPPAKGVENLNKKQYYL